MDCFTDQSTDNTINVQSQFVDVIKMVKFIGEENVWNVKDWYNTYGTQHSIKQILYLLKKKVIRYGDIFVMSTRMIRDISKFVMHECYDMLKKYINEGSDDCIHVVNFDRNLYVSCLYSNPKEQRIFIHWGYKKYQKDNDVLIDMMHNELDCIQDNVNCNSLLFLIQVLNNLTYDEDSITDLVIKTVQLKIPNEICDFAISDSECCVAWSTLMFIFILVIILVLYGYEYENIHKYLYDSMIDQDT
jgi:hypothetical protein